MNYWLLKSDPQTYSYDDLERDKRTVWDGVRNNQALGFIRKMNKGDLALIYHSGKDKHIAGLAEITSGPYADPEESDEKLVVVDIRAKRRPLQVVTLAQVKAEPSFADFHLVRMSRLSVMPVSASLWKRLTKLCGL